MRKLEAVFPESKMIAVKEALMRAGIRNEWYSGVHSFYDPQVVPASYRGAGVPARDAQARVELFVDDANEQAVANVIKFAVAVVVGVSVRIWSFEASADEFTRRQSAAPAA